MNCRGAKGVHLFSRRPCRKLEDCKCRWRERASSKEKGKCGRDPDVRVNERLPPWRGPGSGTLRPRTCHSRVTLPPRDEHVGVGSLLAVSTATWRVWRCWGIKVSFLVKGPLESSRDRMERTRMTRSKSESRGVPYPTDFLF